MLHPDGTRDPLDLGDYEAQVSGKVAAVGSRMLEGAARVVLRQLFEQLGRQAGSARRPSWWRRLFGRAEPRQ